MTDDGEQVDQVSEGLPEVPEALGGGARLHLVSSWAEVISSLPKPLILVAPLSSEASPGTLPGMKRRRIRPASEFAPLGRRVGPRLLRAELPVGASDFSLVLLGHRELGELHEFADFVLPQARPAAQPGQELGDLARLAVALDRFVGEGWVHPVSIDQG